MNYGKTSYRMSLKVQFLHVRLDKYKDNIEAYSDMQGERFHQDIIDFEPHFQGSYNKNVMGDYISVLIRKNILKYKRKSWKTSHG